MFPLLIWVIRIICLTKIKNSLEITKESYIKCFLQNIICRNLYPFLLVINCILYRYNILGTSIISIYDYIYNYNILKKINK